MLKHDASVSTSVKDTMNTITVNDDKVVLIAQPRSLYKIIRIINHWIDNLIQFTEDQDSINIHQPWYIKWKSMYKLLRSSKRSQIEIYQLLANDYGSNHADINVLRTVEYIITLIPTLHEYYAIQSVKGREKDKNYFELTVTLFHSNYDDNNNQFNDIRSQQDQFQPFTSNRSITTWNTNKSETSSIHTEPATVPAVVHTDFNETEAQTPTNTTPISETNLSYSPPSAAPLTTKQMKMTKKASDLKSIVYNTCKNEIKSEMGVIREEMEAFQSTMSNTVTSQNQELTQLLESILRPQPNTNGPRVPPTIIPSMYRTNMPSPQAKTDSKPSFFAKDGPPTTTMKSNESSIKPDVPQTSHRQFQRSGTLVFTYNEESFELRDSDFNKHSAKLLTVNTTKELVNLYKQIQSMAVTYNIFLTPFDDLVPWDKTPNTLPSTCMFATIDIISNTVDAYRRMKSALYNKLTKATFLLPEHNAIIQHGGIQQDGFEILYDLMTHCHPKLVTATTKFRQINHRPDFERSDSVYSYISKLQIWIDIEKINNHIVTDDDILNMVLEQLRADTRYDIAVTGIQTDLTLRDTLQRNIGPTFLPEGLKLNNLPGTIMSYYTEDEKKALFPTPNTTSGIIHSIQTDALEPAIINSFRGKSDTKRTSVDMLCPGCGKYGHSVFHNGCDFCASFLLASEFFKKYPNSSTKILERSKEFQLKRQANRKNVSFKGKPDYKSGNTKQFRGKFNKHSTRGKVKMLQDMFNEVLDEDPDEDEPSNASESDIFEDAHEATSLHSDQDSE